MARRKLNGIVRLIAMLVVASVALASALVLALRTETAQDLLAHWAGALASRRGLVVRIEGLRGRPPWNFSIDEIAIDDREGRWLTAGGIVAEAEPDQLVFGRIALPHVSARSLDVARKPERDEPDDDEPPPRLLVDVGELRVDELRLGARLLGDTEAENGAGATPNASRAQGAQRWSRPIAARGFGSYALREEVLRGTFKFDAPDAVGLIPALPELESGAIQLTAVLDGDVDRPDGEIVLTVEQPSHAAFSAERARIRVRGKPAPGLGRDEERAYQIALEASWTGPKLSPHVDPLLGEAATLALRASIAPEGKRVDIHDAALEGAAVTITSAAHLDDMRRLVVPQLTARIADVTKLDGASKHVTAGALQIRSELTADLETNVANGTVDVKASGLRMSDPGLDSLFGPEPALSARIEAEHAGRAVAVSDVRLDAAKASLTGGGSVSGDGRELDVGVAVEVRDLADLAGALDSELAGALRVEATVRGPLEKPTVEAMAVPRDARIAGGPSFNGAVTIRAENARQLPAGSVHAVLQSEYGVVDGGTEFELRPSESLMLRDIAVSAEGARVSGHADVNLETNRVDAELTGDFSDLSALSPLVRGRIGGRGRARLVLAGAGTQRADVSARFANLVYAAGVDVRAARADLDVALSDLHGDPGGTVRLALDDMTVGAASISRAHLDGEGVGGLFQVRAGVEGRHLQGFSLSTVAGLDLRRGLAVSVRSLDGELGGRPLRLERELLVARTDRGGVAVEQLDLSLADARVSGSFGASESGKLDGAGELSALPLDLLSLLNPSIDLRGVLYGRVSFAGTTERPDIGFAVDSDAVEVGAAAGDMPALAVSVEGRWNARGLAANGSIVGGEATRFDVRAELPADDGELAVELTGSANASLLNGLGVLGEDKVRGIVDARIALFGTTQSPRLDGEISWRDGSYENAAIGAVLRKIHARLLGEGTRLRLERFEATDGEDGRVQAMGTIDFRDGLAQASYAMDASLVSLRVARLDELSAEASGEVRIEGRGSSPRITGSIDAERAEIRVPERPSVQIVAFERVTERNAGAARADRYTVPQPPATFPAELALDIRVPGRVFVRGSDIDTEWQGRLQIRGDSAAPRLEGKLTLVRGSFKLINARFKVTEGTIAFDGAEEIDPEIKIVGEASKNEIDARVTVSGRASSLEVKFSSEPALPEDEILARLLFGKDPRQLSAVESVQLAAAVARLSGRGSGPGFDPLGWVRRTLQLDTLDVTSGETADEGSSVRVGKYVTENVFVSVDQGLTESTSSAGVDVEVTRNLSVQSKIGSDREGSLGLVWKWDY